MALGERSEDERSLRDDLAAGLKEIEEREASAPEDDDAPTPQAEANVEPAEANTDRGDGRDAHGKFVAKPKDGEVAAADATPPATEDHQPALGTEAQQPNAEDQPPKSWRADEAQAWKDLPAAAKAAIVRREAEAARLAGANDSERMFGREFAEIVRPHMPTIQQFGVTPQQAIKALLESDRVLRSATPDQKLAHARKLCSDYGIDVAQLALPDPGAASDPHVAALQAEVARLSQRLATPQNQQFAPLPLSAEDSNVQLEIEAFRADPAHPHFDAVHQVMGQLLETGAAPDLESAYQAAVVINPALRSTVATQAQPQRTQEDKTAAARRAAVSVAGSPGQTGDPRPMSLRDELAEGLRSAGFSV